MERSAAIDDEAQASSLFGPLRGQRREVAAIAYLDRRRRLLGMRQTCSGAAAHVALPLRAIAADALALDAAGVVLAHNHPSGDPRPSAADVAATRRLARVLEPIGVRVVDHLVVTASGATSLRGAGVLI